MSSMSNIILIVSKDRLTRALIAAQLKEEGFEVIGSASIMGAVSRLTELLATPALLIIESLELDMEQKAIDHLNRICPGAAYLLIHGACDQPLQLRWTGVLYELAKPLSIGQIVDKVKKIIIA